MNPGLQRRSRRLRVAATLSALSVPAIRRREARPPSWRQKQSPTHVWLDFLKSNNTAAAATTAPLSPASPERAAPPGPRRDRGPAPLEYQLRPAGPSAPPRALLAGSPVRATPQPDEGNFSSTRHLGQEKEKRSEAPSGQRQPWQHRSIAVEAEAARPGT